jgi:hypothetical protein
MMGAAVIIIVTLIVLLSEATEEPLMTTDPVYVPGVWPVCAATSMIHGEGDAIMPEAPFKNWSQLPPLCVVTVPVTPVPDVKI